MLDSNNGNHLNFVSIEIYSYRGKVGIYITEIHGIFRNLYIFRFWEKRIIIALKSAGCFDIIFFRLILGKELTRFDTFQNFQIDNNLARETLTLMPHLFSSCDVNRK